DRLGFSAHHVARPFPGERQAPRHRRALGSDLLPPRPARDARTSRRHRRVVCRAVAMDARAEPARGHLDGVLLRELATRRDAARLRRGRARNESATALLVTLGPGTVFHWFSAARRPAHGAREAASRTGHAVLVASHRRDACVIPLCL